MSASERRYFLGQELTVEEKIDGANLGISFDADGNIRTQNRGTYLNLPESGQWKKLDAWLTLRADVLFDALADRHILFGEWCYARHSIYYDQLPDWFLGFDIYDRLAARFLSAARRNSFFKEIQVAQVPIIAHGHFSLADLKELLARSKYGDQPAEGLYLRFDQNEWLIQRAKLVRPAFIQSMGPHWSRSDIRPNRLR